MLNKWKIWHYINDWTVFGRPTRRRGNWNTSQCESKTIYSAFANNWQLAYWEPACKSRKKLGTSFGPKMSSDSVEILTGLVYGDFSHPFPNEPEVISGTWKFVCQLMRRDGTHIRGHHQIGSRICGTDAHKELDGWTFQISR